ncbi:MAG TPA: cardiolipin synthase B [Phycisphaerales bacterium]|nr:cardiolipin synthase B [Phycisphaerales bacterium]HMP36002.1 cardiolipin synthase B [Phycisphaerales bacterium]
MTSNSPRERTVSSRDVSDAGCREGAAAPGDRGSGGSEFGDRAEGVRVSILPPWRRGWRPRLRALLQSALAPRRSVSPVHAPRFAVGLGGAVSEALASHWERVLVAGFRRHGATGGNRVDVCLDPDCYFERLWEEIAAAERQVWIESYTLECDRVGCATIEALAAAARRGCDAVLLLDAVGSLGVDAEALSALSEAGGRICFYNPPHGGRFLRRSPLHRSHRKLVAIDGTVAYVGGRNISEHYAGTRLGLGTFRDCQLRIEGPAAQALGQSTARLLRTAIPPLDPTPTLVEARPSRDDGGRREVNAAAPARGPDRCDDAVAGTRSQTGPSERCRATLADRPVAVGESGAVRESRAVGESGAVDGLSATADLGAAGALRAVNADLGATGALRAVNDDFGAPGALGAAAADPGAPGALRAAAADLGAAGALRAADDVESLEVAHAARDPVLSPTASEMPGERQMEPARSAPAWPRAEAIAQVLESGGGRGRRAIQRQMRAAFSAARRSIHVATPYFVPPRALERVLRRAASRGIDVRLATAGRSDVPLVTLAGRHLYGRLLRAGVRIFEVRATTLHSKLAVVDGLYAMVGSFNLDRWSDRRNLEITVGLVDPASTAALEAEFDEILALATEVTLEAHRARPLSARLREWLAYQLLRW